MAFDPPGWDVAVYHNAIVALRTTHDPYATAIAIQRLYHTRLAMHAIQPTADPPFSYVYSPITLPLLRLIGSLPPWLSGSFYWLAYPAGVLAEIWVSMQAVEASERSVFLYLAPLAAFFPGLLANGIVLSGNIAYILYAGVLLAALRGWKRGSWNLFYAVTLAASCVKAPLLCLVAIPSLSARRQWIPAGLTTAAGAMLFGMQSILWPTLFAHYLQAVELQFSYNRDFGCSPSGIFAGYLFDRGVPYSAASFVFYLCYAVPIIGLLFYLSRHFLRGAFSLQQWMPVLLVGVILLNPRLIEYDVAPITLLLCLLAWRYVIRIMSKKGALATLSILFAIANTAGLMSWNLRKLIDGPLLVILFATGSWNLLQRSRDYASAEAESLEGQLHAEAA